MGDALFSDSETARMLDSGGPLFVLSTRMMASDCIHWEVLKRTAEVASGEDKLGSAPRREIGGHASGSKAQ